VTEIPYLANAGIRIAWEKLILTDAVSEGWELCASAKTTNNRTFKRHSVGQLRWGSLTLIRGSQTGGSYHRSLDQ